MERDIILIIWRTPLDTIEILGHDPALSNWGFARAKLDLKTMEVSDLRLHLASTKPNKDQKMKKQIDDISRSKKLHKEIKQQSQGVVISFVEVPHGSQSARAMASYGTVIGLIPSINSFSTITMSEREVKLGTLDKYPATKEDSIEWAYEKHPEANWPMRNGKIVKGKAEHMADAVCTIYAGLQTEDFKNAIAILKFAKVA